MSGGLLTFLTSALAFVVALGILIVIHEYGHYRVAVACGVKVLRFSVGFGRPLLRRQKTPESTEFVVAALPLGGYVRMLDEREADVAEADAPQAFNRQPVLQRIAIVAAGPLANLLLCIALLWGMFVIGRPDYAPVVGQAGAIAASAGLERGDTLLSVDGRATPTWSEAAMALASAAMDRRDIPLVVRTEAGSEAQRTLRLSRLPEAARPVAWPTTGRKSGRPITNMPHSSATHSSRLATGPAATIAMRWPTGLRLKACGASAAATSPSRSSSMRT